MLEQRRIDEEIDPDYAAYYVRLNAFALKRNVTIKSLVCI